MTVSMMIVSPYMADEKPALSMNCTYTVFIPSPPSRIQGFDPLKLSHCVKVTLSFERRILATPVPKSETSMLNATPVPFVPATPLLMTTDPVGPAVSSMMLSVYTMEIRPALSRIWYSTVLLPSPTPRIHALDEEGASQSPQTDVPVSL